MNNPQDKKIENLKNFAQKSLIHPNLPIVDELQSISETLKVISEKETPEYPQMPETKFPDVQKIVIEGVETITLKGDKGEKGDKGDTGEQGIQGEKGKPGIKGEKGDRGETGQQGEKGLDGVGKDGVNGSPDTPDQIIEKINSSEEQIDYERVKGLEDRIKKVEGKIPKITGGGGRSSHSTHFYDLSSQTTGSLKIFSVPKSISAVLISSDFPHILMQNNGFTLNSTRTQLTMTTDSAPSAGSQLLYQYSAVFNHK